MSIRTVFAVSIVSASFLAGAAQASSRTPAEFPPSNYAGTQYVDSTGCVFVRAGSGANVSWIPRMDRARNHICNARPSAVAAAPVVAATPAITAAAPVRATIPVTTPNTTNLLIGTSRIARTTPTVTATTSVPLATPATTESASACPNASALSQRYINQGQHGPVRCGPQAVHPMDVHRPSGTTTTTTTRQSSVTGGFLGRPPFEPVNAAPQPPAGYRVAWDDGRLNPFRGNRGATQVARAATTTTSAATVSTRNAPAATRSAPAAATAAAPSGRVAVSVGVGHRYVQVGTYREPNNAQRAIRALQQLGLPAARSTVTSRGTTYQVVLAGPYSDANALGTALYRARQAGFGDAKTRR